MHDDLPLPPFGADRRRLVRAASRLLGPADAEDAVQDACVRALEAGPLELEAGPAWLLTVVRHLAIDRLRRRRRMQDWLATTAADGAPSSAPSAESEAALAEDTLRALRRLAARLTPADGAAVLLHEVFDTGHAEIAGRSGWSEAGSRQRLRRSLARLRAADRAPAGGPDADRESNDDAVFRLYLQSLQLRDPRALWAMLRHSTGTASTAMCTVAARTASTRPATACSLAQVGGALVLALTLDGVRLCVLPLGVRAEPAPETAPR